MLQRGVSIVKNVDADFELQHVDVVVFKNEVKFNGNSVHDVENSKFVWKEQ